MTIVFKKRLTNYGIAAIEPDISEHFGIIMVGDTLKELGILPNVDKSKTLH